MLRNLIFSLIIAIGMVGCAYAPLSSDNFGNKSSFTEMYNHAIMRSVKVELGRMGQCSGVLVGENQVATAAHCAEVLRDNRVGIEDITIHLSDGETILQTNKVLKQGQGATKRDYAVLRTKDNIPKPYSKHVRHHGVVCEDPDVGTRIFHVGSPLGTDNMISFGYVSSYRTDTKGLGTWQGTVMADITAGPGSSGGPVFNMKGELLGLLVGGIRGTGLSMYTKANIFLDDEYC